MKCSSYVSPPVAIHLIYRILSLIMYNNYNICTVATALHVHIHIYVCILYS